MQEELKKVGTTKDCPVVALLRDGALLVGLRHYKSDTWKTTSVWTVPGGRCDEGEQLEKTLRREAQEETGITDFVLTKYLGRVPGAKEGDTVVIFAGTTDQEPTLMEPEKFSEWRWQPLDSMPDNFINAALLEKIKEYAQVSPQHS